MIKQLVQGHTAVEESGEKDSRVNASCINLNHYTVYHDLNHPKRLVTVFLFYKQGN